MEKSYNTLEDILNEMYAPETEVEEAPEVDTAEEGGCGTHKEGADPSDADKFETTCPKCGHKAVLNASHCG